MKKGFLTVLLSILAGGLTAYGVVKANEKNLSPVRISGENGSVEYRTVNLADSDYPAGPFHAGHRPVRVFLR